jgi:hypothetical protein
MDDQQQQSLDETSGPRGSGSTRAPGSASVVQVVRRGETEPQYASRLVWWIASLADWTSRVKVGDIVVEVTHCIGMARHQLGLHSAIGELLAIEETAEGTTYTIRTIEGNEQRWTNAKMCVVESKPNHCLSIPKSAHHD